MAKKRAQQAAEEFDRDAEIEALDDEMRNPPTWGMVCTDVLRDERVTDRHLRVLIAASEHCNGWGYPRPETPATVAQTAGMHVVEVEPLMRDLSAWGWLYEIEG